MTRSQRSPTIVVSEDLLENYGYEICLQLWMESMPEEIAASFGGLEAPAD